MTNKTKNCKNIKEIFISFESTLCSGKNMRIFFAFFLGLILKLNSIGKGRFFLELPFL